MILIHIGTYIWMLIHNIVTFQYEIYRYFPKFSDGQAWANSADPDKAAPDQGLHCLQFPLHFLDALL